MNMHVLRGAGFVLKTPSLRFVHDRRKLLYLFPFFFFICLLMNYSYKGVRRQSMKKQSTWIPRDFHFVLLFSKKVLKWYLHLNLSKALWNIYYVILERSRCFWVQEPLTSKTQPLIASILAEASWSESDNSVGRSWVLQFCQLGSFLFPQFIPFSFFHPHYSLLCGACL